MLHRSGSIDFDPTLTYHFYMDRKKFKEIVSRSLESLPEWFAQKLENIAVVVEDEPPQSVLNEMRVPRGATLFGLYRGIPLDKRGFYYGNVLPDRVSIYMGPILRVCKDESEVERTVRETVMHEIGHYFGLTDEELKRLEYG